MKQLFIIRGVPGAGKTTFAEYFRRLHPLQKMSGIVHYEADMYFLKDGKYCFDASKLHEAHKWCQMMVEMSMSNCSPIIVSNTSTTDKELKPYFDLAEKYGYMVTCLIVENRHNGRDTHNVHEETLKKMKERFSVKL